MIFELTLFTSFTMYHLIIGLGLFLILSAVMRVIKISAELQSWLWATAFVITTLVPFATFVQEPKPNTYIVGEEQVYTNALTAQQIKDLADGKQVPFEVPEPQPEWNIPSQIVFLLTTWLYVFLAIWGLGSGWRALSVWQSFSRTRQLVSSGNQISKNHAVQRISRFPVLTSDKVSTPMATGLVSPKILIPTSLMERFNEEQLVPIVLHELAHIKRKDLWVSLFQETLAIIFWWSPVMRILNNKIHISRELACDMRAAEGLSSGKQYAQSLVDCAQLMVTERCNVQAMGLFSKKKELTFRVNEMLKIKNIKAPKALTTAVSCVALTIATVSIAQAYMPKINVSSVEQEANYFSKLSRAKGEMLMEAIKDQDYGMIDLMIKNGLDINTPIRGDGTALIVAVKTENREMVEALIKLGANVDQAARGDGSPLIAASWKGNVDLARMLIEKGAGVNKVVPGDETALINASRRGHLDFVELLVENGADVNLGLHVDNRGRTGTEYRSPLNMASNKKIIDYLISKGAKK